MLFWVNLSTDLLRVQRIAFFGENVYILYVVEMARNSGLLLLIYTLANPEKGKVSRCIVDFSGFHNMAKKVENLDLQKSIGLFE